MDDQVISDDPQVDPEEDVVEEEPEIQEPTDRDLDLIDGIDKRHEEVKPPSVLGEEDPFSGDATDSESPDIDDELSKVGLAGDDDGIKPLGVEDELDDEAV